MNRNYHDVLNSKQYVYNPYLLQSVGSYMSINTKIELSLSLSLSLEQVQLRAVIYSINK
jgi:hypothetical protein